MSRSGDVAEKGVPFREDTITICGSWRHEPRRSVRAVCSAHIIGNKISFKKTFRDMVCAYGTHAQIATFFHRVKTRRYNMDRAYGSGGCADFGCAESLSLKLQPPKDENALSY